MSEDQSGVASGARADALSWAFLLALGVIWGASFSATSVAVEETPPLTVAAARLGIGAVLLMAVSVVATGGPPAPRGREGRRFWAFAFAAAAFSNAVPFALLAWAQGGGVDSGLAAIFMAATPLIVLPLAAWFAPGDRMTVIKTIGFCIGFLGVAVLIGVDALSGLGGDASEVLMQLACLAAASCYAIGAVALKRARVTDPIGFAALTLVLAALIAAPLALIFEQPWEVAWTGDALLALGYLGALPTALAMLMLLTVIRRAGPTFLSMVNYMVPLWGMAFGVVFLKEDAPPSAPIALALILTGVAVSQGAHRTIGAQLRRARSR